MKIILPFYSERMFRGTGIERRRWDPFLRYVLGLKKYRDPSLYSKDVPLQVFSCVVGLRCVKEVRDAYL